MRLKPEARIFLACFALAGLIWLLVLARELLR